MLSCMYYLTYIFIHDPLLQQFKILTQERVVSIRDLQKHPSQALQGVTRIVKNGKSLGIFFDEETLEDMLEDFEAMSSPKYLASIRKSDKEIKEGKVVSLAAMKKEYGL